MSANILASESSNVDKGESINIGRGDNVQLMKLQHYWRRKNLY